MSKTLVFFGTILVAVWLFFSGSMPNTLVYNLEGLEKLNFEGDKPYTVEVIECDLGNTDKLSVGDRLSTTFRASVENHTDRYVALSAIGEVYNPRGGSSGMNSQLLILNPNAIEETSFSLSTIYVHDGEYKCEMRYDIWGG